MEYALTLRVVIRCAAGLLVTAGVLFAWSGCATHPDEEAGHDPGTAEMAAALQRIYAQALADPMPYVHLNARRAGHWRQEVQRSAGPAQRQARYNYASELLNAGDTEAAIRQLDTLIASLGDRRFALTPESKPLFDLLAVAYLRLGEQQNCIVNHSAEACILPLVGGGIHTLQDGSRRAIGVLEELLAAFPTDLRSRWLLNVAYMTLGQYPDGVPPAWRIPGLAPRGGAGWPRFPNVALRRGVAVNGLSGGISIADFDGNGFLDLFATSYGLNDPVRLFLADSAGGYVDRTGAAGLAGITGGLNTVHADYDNDGFEDVFILRGAWLGDHGAHPNSLLRNRGDGTFEDVTARAGLLSYHPTQTAAWGDFNNDGWIDLFVGNESGGGGGMGRALPAAAGGATPHPSELFLNRGDGTFEEVAARVGLDVTAFVKGAVWGDVDNDGLLDLYVSVLNGPNRLYMNRGGTTVPDWRFEDVAEAAGVQAPHFSFPCWFWDFDNDGWEDLFVASYDATQFDATPEDAAREFLGLPVLGEPARLYRNNGDGTFTDLAAEAGVARSFYAMGANTGDLDNDGYPDFYIGNGAPDLGSLIPNRMFRNVEGRRFVDVTFEGGFGHLQKGHGVAFADLDRDGDQDVYAVMGGAVEGDVFPNALFLNPGPASANAWVVLRLEGRTANRSAVGARIRVTASGPEGRRVVFSTVSSGGSFGANSLLQEIGLGPADRIDEIQVTWPNEARTTEVFTGLEPRRYYHVVEGRGIESLPYEPAPGAAHPDDHAHAPVP